MFQVLSTALDGQERARLARATHRAEVKSDLPYVSDRFPGPALERPVASERRDGEATDAAARAIAPGAFDGVAPPTEEEAIQLSMEVLDRAEFGRSSWAPAIISAEPRATPSCLEVALGEGERAERRSIHVETHVDYSVQLAGLPLVGPGAKIKFVWGSGGRLDLLWFEMPRLEAREPVELIDPEEAFRSYAASLRFDERELEYDTSLVYFLAAGTTDQVLVPKYRIQASIPAGDEEGGRIELQAALVPAKRGGFTVDLKVEEVQQRLRAKAVPSGGQAPYRFRWYGSTVPPGGLTGDAVTLDKPSNLEGEREYLQVSAEDSSGAVASARGLVPTDQITQPADPSLEVGSEWAGNSGLTTSFADSIGPNAQDFIAAFRAAGWTVVFNRGEEQALEPHFVEESPDRDDGLDHEYADNAAMVLFSGHGAAYAFYFPEERLDFRDHPQWGNQELRWLLLNACSVLQLEAEDYGPWYIRWGPAFAGLHLLFGFATVAENLPGVGEGFANRALSGRKLRAAWAETSIAIQESDVEWAVMGVIDDAGYAHWADTVADAGSNSTAGYTGGVRGYWLMSGPS